MLRTRLILLVTVAALVAPSLAPCLIAAPASHAAMACCPPSGAGMPPAWSCCAAGDEQPLPAPQTVTPMPQASPLAAVAPAPIASSVARRLRPQETARARLLPRLLSAVLLI